MATVRAEPGTMRLHESTVGRKVLMAVSGVVLVLFVLGHMIGNLKVYQGPEAFNHYAEGLRTFGDPFLGRGHALWIVRIALIVAVLLHLLLAVQLYLRARTARPQRYRKYDPEVFSRASRTMVWGGITILAFVIYHLMHFTFGNVHPDFIHGNAYHNFVSGFQVWPVSLVYILAMIPLGMHLYHGIWSGFQTMGVYEADGRRWRRPLAAVVAWVIVLGNVSFPVAVLAGIVP